MAFRNMLPCSFSEVGAVLLLNAHFSLVLCRDRSVGHKEEIARHYSPLVVFHLTAKRWHVQVKGIGLGISTSH